MDELNFSEEFRPIYQQSLNYFPVLEVRFGRADTVEMEMGH